MVEDIEISTHRHRLDIDYIHSILKTTYWAEGIPKNLVEKSINNSLCFGVYKNNRQIGFARAVTDITIFAYVADVFIDPQEQGKGYGKKLLQAITSHKNLQLVRRWHLITKDAQNLYEKFGFSIPQEPKRHMEKICIQEWQRNTDGP